MEQADLLRANVQRKLRTSVSKDGRDTNRVCWVVPCRQEVDFLFIWFLVDPLMTLICGYFSDQTVDMIQLIFFEYYLWNHNQGEWSINNIYREENRSSDSLLPFPIVVDFMGHLEEELWLKSLEVLKFTVAIDWWAHTVAGVDLPRWGSKVAKTILPD